MNLWFHPHARRAMERRHVSEEQVREALENWDTQRPGDEGARMYIGPTTLGRRLKVVLFPPGLEGEPSMVRVKTVAWPDEEG